MRQVCWSCARFLTSYHHALPVTLQKEQLEVKESRGSRGSSGMTEDEVFSKVASLFKGQEDLLAEFGQFLPDAKRSLVSWDMTKNTILHKYFNSLKGCYACIYQPGVHLQTSSLCCYGLLLRNVTCSSSNPRISLLVSQLWESDGHFTLLWQLRLFSCLHSPL